MMKLNISYGPISTYYQNDHFKAGLKAVYSLIGDIPYKVLGIDSEGIRNSVKSINSGDFFSAYSSINMAKIKEFASEKDCAGLCEFIVFDELVGRYIYNFAGKEDYPKAENAKIKDRIFFINDSEDWVVVKKMGAGKERGKREVAAFLLGIKASVFDKMLTSEFGNAARKRGAEEAAKLLKGSRKSVNALKRLFEKSNSGKDAVLFIEGAMLLGYGITPNYKALKKAFPELKLPGIRGRKPK